MKITIRDVWKKYNVSSVMILPIFNDITKGIKGKNSSNDILFTQLIGEYNLLNTYLLRNRKFTGELYLVFDREIFNSDLRITKADYYSLCDLILDSKYFSSMEIINDIIIVGLQIPKKYYPDIDIIIKGKYSKLSKEYKKRLHIYQEKIPITNNEITYFISLNDLGFAISMKGLHIKEMLEQALDVDLDSKNDEFYVKFDKDQENLINSKVKKFFKNEV